MSRHNVYDRDTEPIFNAAGEWRQRCLEGDGQLFNEEALWTPDTLEELDRAFVQNPLEGDASYGEKLGQQLEGRSPAACRLMAELHWVLFLFPHNIKPQTKREQIRALWEKGGDPLNLDHLLLQDDTLSGVAHAGRSFNTNRWRELGFLIRITQALKALGAEQRRDLLADPWRFAEWLDGIPRDGQRQLRHILPYLLFPDDFERCATGRDKHAILQHLGDYSSSRLNQSTPLGIDQALRQLRERLEQEQGEPIDFYASPWLEQWHQSFSRTWLLLWNPQKWPWESLKADRNRIVRGENVTGRWSTASKQPREGDTVYLMRVGSPPKGLVARGSITKPAYEDTHWEENQADAGETAQFVGITLTDLRDPEHDDILSLEQLQQISGDQAWTPQASGIEIKPEAAHHLHKAWTQLQPVQPVDVPPRSNREQALAIGTPINRILYGPPGTGKTHYLREQVMPHYETPVTQAASQEWLEEQLADNSWWEAVALALADLGGRGTVNDLLEHSYFLAKARVQGRTQSPNLRATCWNSLQTHTVLTSEKVNLAQEKRQQPLIFDKEANGTWLLTGDWEDACGDLLEQLETLRKGPESHDEPIRRYRMVTFHQSFSYEDFVEGIRPQPTESGISYEVHDGILKAWCRRAQQDPEHRYALLIDEINRGNIARIFGELITLIEADKRSIWDEDGQLLEGVEVTLPYSGERFGVPKNLDIYATMNTADRSIALMDVALRRRFHFQELTPSPSRIPGSLGDGLIPDEEGDTLDLRALLKVLNMRLRFLLHRDQTFGHAYFMTVKGIDDLRHVLVYDIIPMLAEYFYEDWRQIRLVLGDEQAPADQQIVTTAPLRPEELFPGLDIGSPEKPDYDIKAPQEITGEAIRKIYAAIDEG